MLNLRTLDPARQTAERRVALAFGYGILGAAVFFAMAAGAGQRVLFTGIVIAIAGVPWVFAYNGRCRLVEDATRGVPFAWRGDRSGIWACAPIGGALLVLMFVPSLLLALAGAIAYPLLIAGVERRYERLIVLDLTVLETRFKSVTDARVAPRLIAASALAEMRRGVGPADGDLEV